MRNAYLKTLALLAAVAGLAVTEFRASAQTTLLVGWTNLWAYNDTTTPTENLHGTGWELPAYDTNSAAGWKTGPALFGNDGAGLYDGPGRPFSGGINGFLTPLNRGIAAASDRVTFYFRKSFNYSGPTGVILETKWVHDDGFIVYLNGTEILRSKMQVPAPDPVTWTTLGANHDAAGFPPVVVEGFEYSQDLPSTALVAGENVIAVELHQSSTTSSDVSFAMEMKAVVPFAPAITNAAQPADRVVLQNRSTTLAVFAIGSRPVSYQWFFQPAGGGGFTPILDATNSTYTIASMQLENAGDYYATVSNPVGSIDSRIARVSFSTDNDPPFVVRASQAGSFDRVVIEYNEAVDPTTAEDEFNYEVYDSGNNALGVNLATLNPGGFSVTLSLAFPMAENDIHTASITTVADLTGVNVITTTNVPLRSWVSTASPGVLFEAFDTSSVPGGNTVVSLTSHPNYPNNPRDTEILAGMDSRLSPLYSTDANEQYGARIRTLFVPPNSGNWIFYLWADDGAQLFVNPTGPGATGKQLLLDRSTCCGDFNGPGSQSAPQNLIAGQAYYVEALYKEGTGGDYGKVIARLQGEPVPATTDPGLLAPTAAPAGVAGTFTINQPPVDQTAVPNSTVTFTVGTTTDVPLRYQWLRDGVEIPNATGASSILPRYTFVATTADNGARFSVRVSIIGGPTLTSTEAILTVAPDTIRPSVLSVAANTGGTSLTVTFSEPVGASAAVAANYTINGVTASSATQTSPTVATVVPATPLQGGGCALNEVRISGISDLATVPNLINPNPTIVSLSSPQVVILPLGATWKYLDDGSDQGTAWRNVGFSDTAWLSGPAPLGFEPGAPQVPPVATPISDVTTNKTAYFRTHFTLGVDPSTVLVLQLSQIADDGTVVYLNGVEALRTRMPAAPAVIDASTLATAGGPEPANGTHTVEFSNIPKTGLVAGDNVLAVELHPNSLTSSDSEFAAQLSIVLCLPTLVIERVGSQVRLTWSDAAYRLETASAPTGPWTSQAGGSGLLLNASSGNAFFRLSAP